jgi:hypothetical protein
MPYSLQWGANSATACRPIICSRLTSTIKSCNAIGTHSGPYSIYEAARKGEIEADGKIVLKSRLLMKADGLESDVYSGVKGNVSKDAIQRVCVACMPFL